MSGRSLCPAVAHTHAVSEGNPDGGTFDENFCISYSHLWLLNEHGLPKMLTLINSYSVIGFIHAQRRSAYQKIVRREDG